MTTLAQHDVVVIAPELRPEQWVTRISGVWQQSVEAIIETGRLLTEAKAALPHGEFGVMIESELPFGGRTAQMLMAIAADPRLTNRNTVSHLPPSWGSLYELTKYSDDQFEAKIADGTIRPDMERREVINGARSIMGSRQEPDDSLDYFPTPPWGARALIERVLPQIGVNIQKLGSIWEPACGEGHIAEVLSEYCPRVCATDVFDYGYGDTCDFLATPLRVPDDAVGIRWIITNPPFGNASLEFVKRALVQAGDGVAMFFRSQWAVEGIERYETIFRDQPPSLCAFFVERVNLCKGRWDPDGSTATAYCWLVWIKGKEPQPTFWIPPGQREALTHPDDADRFTAHPVIRKQDYDPRTGEIQTSACVSAREAPK